MGMRAPDINVWAVLVAVLVVFVVSSVWYTVFGATRAATSGAPAASERPAPWKIAAELARSATVAAVVAGLADKAGADDWVTGVALAAALWLAFPFVLLTGSIMWESVSWRLAAVHAGDWLLKLVAISVIVSVWR
jgi:Protein of unknown function (DUF1761)